MSEQAGADLVNAVERALALLDAFTIDDPSLSLAELSRRTNLPKTSALRLARTLAARGYLSAVGKGGWRLGPATASLGARYQVAFDVENLIEPVMRNLAKTTRHSVSYFVQEGEARIRLLRVPGEEEEPRPARVGEPMPMDKGSPGQVLLAFAGRPGALYDEIRQRGYHFTIGEARKVAASVAAPVFGARWDVVGALCIGVPSRLASEALLKSMAPGLIQAAAKLSRGLSTVRITDRPLTLARSTWFPPGAG